ncbi:uncharacterized protein MCAP_0864-like [Schistocerca americana]|uniref:uncharacterized protein MCAP_0864-like n=1 Tax=Schistocerca americana TaxID=7009 RepID=UPI001F501208|nr:uncharacterized protein MCAP_0864-like [Schistocerca americana]
MSIDSPLGHSTGYPETLVKPNRKELSLEGGESHLIIFKMLQEIMKGYEEINKNIEEISKGNDEIKKGNEEIKKGNEEIKKENEEIKKSIAEMSQESLRKGLQEFHERMRITLKDRVGKLQVKVDQLLEEMNVMKAEIIGKAEGDVEGVKTELEEGMQKTETQQHHQIKDMVQIQQCQVNIGKLGNRQVKLEEAVEHIVTNEVKGVQQLETKTEGIDRKINCATLTVGEGKSLY